MVWSSRGQGRAWSDGSDVEQVTGAMGEREGALVSGRRGGSMDVCRKQFSWAASGDVWRAGSAGACTRPQVQQDAQRAGRGSSRRQRGQRDAAGFYSEPATVAVVCAVYVGQHQIASLCRQGSPTGQAQARKSETVIRCPRSACTRPPYYPTTPAQSSKALLHVVPGASDVKETPAR